MLITQKHLHTMLLMAAINYEKNLSSLEQAQEGLHLQSLCIESNQIFLNKENQQFSVATNLNEWAY